MKKEYLRFDKEERRVEILEKKEDLRVEKENLLTYSFFYDNVISNTVIPAIRVVINFGKIFK